MADPIIVTNPRTGQQVVQHETHTRIVLDEKKTVPAIREDDPDILVVEARGPRGEPGAPGAPGGTGPQGPPGPVGAQAKSLYDIWLEQGNPPDQVLFFQSVHSVGYRYVQLTPDTVWRVTHPLQTGMPSVSLVDSNGEEMYGDVAYLPPHDLTISFSAPVSGEAYLT